MTDVTLFMLGVLLLGVIYHSVDKIVKAIVKTSISKQEIDEMQRQIDDLKRELEEMKRK